MSWRTIDACRARFNSTKTADWLRGHEGSAYAQHSWFYRQQSGFQRVLFKGAMVGWDVGFEPLKPLLCQQVSDSTRSHSNHWNHKRAFVTPLTRASNRRNGGLQ